MDHDRGTSTVHWLLVAGAWVVAVLAVLAWLGSRPGYEIREQLKRAQFWSLEACVALGLVVLTVLCVGSSRDSMRRLRWPLTALVLFALALTLFVAPRTNRIYFDEQIYQNIGQNLADLRLAQMCNDGVVEYGRLQCGSGEYNKQPYGYPHLLSLFYRAFGVKPDVAFSVNAVVMALTVCAVSFATLLLFGDVLAAAFAGLLIIMLPQQLLWSATAAVEPSASLACAVAVLAAAYFRHAGSVWSMAAMGIAAVYAVQFRPESLLILPVVLLVAWPQIRMQASRPAIWWIGLLCFVLAAVHIGHLFAVRNEGWGTTEERLSFKYVALNLPVNGWFFLADERFPTIVTVLALAGLLQRGQLRERCALLLYFASFFGIQLLFYAGSYNYGADVRYSLLTYPPLVILAGRGASELAATLGRFISGRAWMAVTAGLLFQFLWYLPVVRATSEEAWAARADVRFAESVAPSLRGNSFVLAHNPGMFHVLGVNAGQMSLVFNNPSYVDYLGLRFSGGVYLHWNFWCNVPVPEQQALCRLIGEQRQMVPVHEYKERDQYFAIYRILTNRPTS
jgi:4-amino-4-deoxy-L-arabinose transferase-like glycosyltransferase